MSSKLMKLENWKNELFHLHDDMEGYGESVLTDHIKSIISELDFQIKDILKDGAIIEPVYINIQRNEIKSLQDAKTIVDDITRKLF